MHLSCFTSKYKYVDFPKLVQNVQIVFSKGCYKAVGSPKALTGSNNGPVGREVAGCLETILLHWLTEEGNYAYYRGGPQTKGKTKKKVAAQITHIINDKGVFPQKNAKQVENKIHHIEKQFRTAHDLASTVTGAGLQENDRGSFDSPCPVQHSQDSRVRSGRVSPGPDPSDPVRQEHGLGEHGFPGEGQGGVVSLGHGGIRTLDLINIKDSELALIVLQENGTRLGLGKLGHKVPDFSDPGLVTRYQAEVLQPVEGRASDSSPPSGGFRPST
jgi:hypothetical protein